MSREPTVLPSTEEELAGRAQQGCTASFEELVRRFQVPLLHFLRQRLPAADAEDVLQETFVRAYRNLHRYRPAWRFGTWLFTIARRLGVNHQRRTRPAVDADALESLAADTPQPAAAAAEADSRRHLWELANDALTEPQATALWLYYVEEMSIQEIARIQGRTRVGVKTMLFRARKRLLPLLDHLRPPGSSGRGDPVRQRSSSPAAEVTHG